MKTVTFASRNAKEILRDPLNVIFGLGFPVVLLFLLTAIQSNIPTPLFEIEKLAPGISVFGLSFISLFSATLVAKDRESSLLQRLYTTPLTPINFILGYMLPLLPIALGQTAVSYTVAVFLGLPIKLNILFAVLLTTPTAIFNIALGLLCGSVLNSKQVGGVCGALLTNLSAWLSGIWFDLSLIGGAFQKIAQILPFYHAVELQRAIINNNPSQISSHIYIVIFYAAITTIAAVLLFLRQMAKN